MFCKKGVLRNFAKFTGKHLCQRLFFNKVAKKRLWHRCFPMIFEKFSFLTELDGWLLLQYPPFNVGKQLCESLILSKLDYYNILFKSLPKYQKIRVGKLLWVYAVFVNRKYGNKKDVINLSGFYWGGKRNIQKLKKQDQTRNMYDVASRFSKRVKRINVRQKSCKIT